MVGKICQSVSLGGPGLILFWVTVNWSKLGFNTGAGWVSYGIMLHHTHIYLFGGFNSKGEGVLTTGGMIPRVISVWDIEEVLAHESPHLVMDTIRS